MLDTNKSEDTMQDPRSILITGASSGIGWALALAYAKPGVTLFLGGRDGDRLSKLAVDCAALGASVHERGVDVTDRPAMAAWIADSDAIAPLDLVIANAGITTGTNRADALEPEAQVRRLFAVNVDGVLNTVLPALPLMQSRERGQIALMSSMAGFRGLAGASTYCATKAAVRVLGEGLRGSLNGVGIGVSVICPGYVRTPMTDANSFPMPFLMSVEKAACIIRTGLARNRSRIAFPRRMYAALWLLQVLPVALTDAIVARLPRKGDAAD
jgi:NADP-dependent 3-hydroxy acid dehydrogenase YdfG